jgi:maltose O-acetyltransferase
MIRHLINIFLYCLPPTRFFSIRRFLLRLGRVEIAKNCSYCGHGWVYGRGKLHLGDNTWISPRGLFYTHQDAEIFIGSNCDIGPNVSFIIGSHLIAEPNRRAGLGLANPIHVGDGTWIGASVTVIDGVKIGNGCVVAAGSVVTKNVPDNSLVAGTPAILKRKL